MRFLAAGLLRLTLAALLSALSAGCRSAPEAKNSQNPILTYLDLEVVDQGFNEYRVRLEGEVTSPEAAVLQSAQYEILEDGKVVKRGAEPLREPMNPNEISIFHFEQTARFSSSTPAPATDLARVAVRGKLAIDRKGQREEVDYAISREVHRPRLPFIRIREVDAARYSGSEVALTVRLGAVNPNAFPVALKDLIYSLFVGGKQMGSGTLAQGDTLDASTTAIYEIPVSITPQTYGPDAAPLIQTRSLPCRITGSLRGQSFDSPFALTAEVKLNAPK